jgi:hypothetical protein
MEDTKGKHRRTSSTGSLQIGVKELEVIWNHIPQCSCKKISKMLKKTCDNECRQIENKSCPRAHQWLHIAKIPANRKEIYHELQSISIESEKFRKYVEQIDIDLTRTFPGVEYFTDGQGVNALRRVLMAFVKYHYQLGYVQGMNYLVCVLLWHASEVDAFWLFVILMDEYKLRENYLFRFPGLTKHCELTELLLSVYMPKLYLQFSKCDIMVQMFATDWYLTLFTSLVPIENSGKIIGNFFKQGWVFAYKFLIILLERLEDRLLSKVDRIDILGIIKPLELVNNDSNLFLNYLKKKKEQLTWEKLSQTAKKKNLDMRHINNFLQNYHMELFNE